MKIIYWIATGLLTLLMLFSAGMYLTKHEEILQTFASFNYPGYIVYPLAILKLSGITVILLNKWKKLKEWAYAGFFFNFVLAFFAHQQAGDGEWAGALVALVLLLTSYFVGKKVRP
ncbi:DoxX family protein [Aquimarina mytili]|uniref:DoxX family protein n=1 Tax=Aquimarina mytili TaxID=874423 RepID=A0A936ZVE2_9FLAO|nr:DoxX family protein [Aquimarina mytili]MBL0685383.1 DoxX family protein [Aquimarina mytili]